MLHNKNHHVVDTIIDDVASSNPSSENDHPIEEPKEEEEKIKQEEIKEQENEINNPNAIENTTANENKPVNNNYNNNLKSEPFINNNTNNNTINNNLNNITKTNNNHNTEKIKKKVTFHPSITQQQQSNLNNNSTSSTSTSTTINNNINTNTNNNNIVNKSHNFIYKHPIWLIQCYQQIWREKLEKDENFEFLTSEILLMRPIDPESPIWYFIPKNIVNNLEENHLIDNIISPNMDVYFNYWSTLRDSLFLKLRKQRKSQLNNLSQNEKNFEESSQNNLQNNSSQLWYGYHNAAILSFLIETNEEVCCDLKKAMHFKLMDLLMETMSSIGTSSSYNLNINTINSNTINNSSNSNTNVKIFSEQEVILLRTLIFLYIETNLLFHAALLIFYFIKNSDGIFDCKIIYLFLKLITKYLDWRKNNNKTTCQKNQQLNNTNVYNNNINKLINNIDETNEFIKIDKGLSKISTFKLISFRKIVIQQICKRKPTNDLYQMWKEKWEHDIPQPQPQTPASSATTELTTNTTTTSTINNN
ncbi:hypothetical protein ABK040_009186 [Willaertia magna]